MTVQVPGKPIARVFDLIEQVALVLLYACLVYRLLPSEFTATSWYPLILLVSEGIGAVVLLLRRRTDSISLNPGDWLIAAAATYFVLAVAKGGTPIAPTPALILMLSGLCIQVGAKLTLLRSFGLVAAPRGLVLKGVYSHVRHPMYAGYLLSHIGFLLWAPTLWNLAVYTVAWSCMIARIYAEERVLGEDPEYQAYMSRVRYRLIPFVF